MAPASGGDYVARASAANGFARAFCGSFRDTVETARVIHGLSPTAADALGRLLMGTSIMGLMLKSDDDLLTVRMKGDGPLGGILATVGNDGIVKGYAINPKADLPPRPDGKTDVGGAIGAGSALPTSSEVGASGAARSDCHWQSEPSGAGTLTVTKDLGLKEPYVSQTPLISGEVAEDLAHYFTVSEQTPSAVSLGVTFAPDGSVRAAGGLIIQMMPGASDALAAYIEQTVLNLPPMTKMLEDGLSPEGILTEAFGGFETSFLERAPVAFRCDCSEERVENALLSLSIHELRKIRDEDGQAELTCHFCNKRYHFGKERLDALIHERIQAFVESLKPMTGPTPPGADGDDFR